MNMILIIALVAFSVYWNYLAIIRSGDSTLFIGIEHFLWDGVFVWGGIFSGLLIKYCNLRGARETLICRTIISRSSAIVM